MEKIYFKTFGCSNNFAESEIMKGIVKKNFEVAKKAEDADIIVINICTVKGDDSSLSEIKKIRKEFPYKSLIIAGCIPVHLIKKIREIAPECGMINTHNIDQINDVVEEVINNHPIEMLARTNLVKLGFPRVRKRKLIGIIPISNSCLGKCSYCSVRQIKGKFYSFPEEKIIKEVKSAVSEGCKEIWITSQDNGCYGIDTGTNLVNLLKKIIAVEGDFYIRLGMMNPNSIKNYIDELVDVFRDKKMFKFIHIPVQSGSNDVLKSMGRQYKVEDFKDIVAKFRKVIPDITVATDVIVGFPSENKEEFEKTTALIKEIAPSVVNISKFRKRPGTAAAKLQMIPTPVIHERSKIMSTTFEWVALYVNRKWKGWEGIILIDEFGKDNTAVGRNAYYKPVVIPRNTHKIGDKVKVRVSRFTKYALYV